MDEKLEVTHGIDTKIRRLEISGFNGSKFNFLFVKFLPEHVTNWLRLQSMVDWLPSSCSPFKYPKEANADIFKPK
jgi:hypothetical protein